jgi:hypothetical protein
MCVMIIVPALTKSQQRHPDTVLGVIVSGERTLPLQIR